MPYPSVTDVDLILQNILLCHGVAADSFYISIPGPTLSYVPLYYGQEKGLLQPGRTGPAGFGGARHRRREQPDVGRDRCHLPCRQRFFRRAARCAGKSHFSHARPADA